ncbi:hypothetical protein DFH28DRAFT_285112 [Melampsora americana]|nr:hypothetical protein DFH28DRAFT_285112 [Melampsora americana]
MYKIVLILLCLIRPFQYLGMELPEDMSLELSLKTTPQIENTQKQSFKDSNGYDEVHCMGKVGNPPRGFQKYETLKMSNKKLKINHSQYKTNKSSYDQDLNDERQSTLHHPLDLEHERHHQKGGLMKNLNFQSASGQEENNRGSSLGKRKALDENFMPRNALKLPATDLNTALDLNIHSKDRIDIGQPIPQIPESMRTPKWLFGVDLNLVAKEDELGIRNNKVAEGSLMNKDKQTQTQDHLSTSEISHEEGKTVSESSKVHETQSFPQSVDDIFTPQSTRIMNDGKVNIGIDMQKVKEYRPIAIYSSAAIYLTHDLVKLIQGRYEQGPNPERTLKESGKRLWTFDLLLPHVYFILTQNPTFAMWEKIKRITGYVCRSYHLWYTETNAQLDPEHLISFLWWQTDVIYQICKNPSISKLIEDWGHQSMQNHYFKRMPPLLRMLQLVYDPFIDDRDFFKFKQTSCFLRSYLSITWKSDFDRGYPDGRWVSDTHESYWMIWRRKSQEIKEIGKTLTWPSSFEKTLSKNKCVLLANEDIDKGIQNETNIEIREFLMKWKSEFKSMLLTGRSMNNYKNVSMFNSSPYQGCFDSFLSLSSQRIKSNSRSSSLSEYNVNVFGKILEGNLGS